MKSKINNNKGFCITQLLVGIIVTCSIAFFTHIILKHISGKDVLESLQKTSFLIPGLIVAGFNLRFKLLELSGKSSNTISENERIKEVVIPTTRILTKFMILYIFSSISISLGPLLDKCFSIETMMAYINIILFSICVYTFILILIAFDELEDFKIQLDEREVKSKERNRLLKKMDEVNSDSTKTM